MRPPRLNAVRMFDAAARHLNFRHAAEELNLTQGAVAQSVRGLEADLGVTLFRRLARGLALTEAGSAYHSEISRGLSIIDEAIRLLHPKSNTVSISVPPSFASKWLVPRLPDFAESHPDIEVRIIATEAVTDFNSQDIDVAVRQGRRPTVRNAYVQMLTRLQLCAFGGPDAKLPARRSSNLKRLAGSPLIQDSHRYWERLLPEAGARLPSKVLQFNQTALALDAAANGQGVAIAPSCIAERDVELGRLIEIWRETTPNNLGLWLISQEAESANQFAREALVDWLLQAFRPVS
ncbi:MAG: LysR substrate-binding domain-containing protein [Pseudomonadota bacterium]